MLDLVSLHRLVLVFLQAGSQTVERRCDLRVRLVRVLPEGSIPAEINQGGDDYDFNQ